VLKKVTHYAQYYAYNYSNYATVQLQILLFLNQVHAGQRSACDWLLEIAFVRDVCMRVCVCVCVCPRGY